MTSLFARPKTASAIAAVLAAAAATSPAYAVNHSDTGLGDFALSPYYTVRAGYDTNISVVNTSDVYVASFKIRFREGSNSRDARDFNVYLSPNDVWTATVTMGADGETPILRTADQSCTAPWVGTNPEISFVPDGTTADGRQIRYINFTNIGYAGGSVLPPDGGPTTIERAQEGYFEVIEMGVAVARDANGDLVSTLADYAMHPTPNCQAIAAVQLGVEDITVTGSDLDCQLDTNNPVGGTATGTDAFNSEYCEPLNILKVAANLTNIPDGVATGMPISMLSNFANPNNVEVPTAPAPADISRDPGSDEPNATFAIPAQSIQIANGIPIQGIFDAQTADAVSTLYSATSVTNEYAVGGAANAQNAWVVTFPTKWAYVDPEFSNDATPFENLYSNGVSCVTTQYDYYDREENGPATPIDDLLPSPPPVVEIPPNSICDEAQVLNFGTESLLGSQHNYFVTREDGFDNGWMRLTFPQSGAIVSNNAVTFAGLPTIGFSYKTLDNGVVDNASRTYGIAADHAYQRDITSAPTGL